MFSQSGHVMTLANSIIGVGILAMPFCFQKCGIILSIVLLILSNWVTRICCHYLIKSSLLTRRKSFEFLGFHTFGSSGKLLVELCIIGYLLGTCITYFVVVGDLGPQIVTKMFSLENGHVHLRTLIMIAVTLVCILPLGMLKNVDSLSTVCTASIGFYVCLVIKIVLESEEHIVANDWTAKVLYWEPAGVLQCLPIFSMALSCQMQLFEVFAGVNNQSLEKLNGIVRNATWICTLVYIAVGFFGYVAFCTQTFAGNILMNFSPSFGSDVIKIGFILSVAFSFPLVIFPCRASIYSLLYRKGHTDATGYIPETRFKAITVFIVTFALCVALMIPSVELIIGLVGSTIGVAICIMFPASCFRKIIKKDSTERMLAQFIFVGGFCLMILGTYANLNAIDVKVSGAHLDMPKVEENLIRPSELPKILVQEKLDLIDKVIFNELKKSKEANMQDTVVNAANTNKLSNVVGLEKPKELNIAAQSSSSSPPPLPVDDNHEEQQQPMEVKLEKSIIDEKAAEPSLIKYSVVSPQTDLVDIVPLELNKTLEIENKKDLPLPESLPPKVTDAAESLKNAEIKNTTQQNINKDAIKNNEEIAAEELKETNKEVKAKENELKETQNELKKTKELLERKVDELKEELAKQTKETQNLVVEKLGEVVEKVEQIERKVQQQETVEAAKDAAVPQQQQQQQQEKSDEPQRKNKGSLISMLSEAGGAEREAKKAPVYEPLSYKTGELLEKVAAQSNGKLDQRLPLPLALLINASQIKLSEGVLPDEQLPKESKPNQILKQAETMANLSLNSVKYEKVASDVNELKEKAKDKENVEAIRRDILYLNPSQQKDASSPSGGAAERVKRAAPLDGDGGEALLKHENCLTAPKLESLLEHGVNGVNVDFKMQLQGIGRVLKSLPQAEDERQ